MLLLQSRGWQQNARFINRSGQALGDLLAGALSPTGVPPRRTSRTTEEQMDALKQKGYYGVMTEEERLAPYDREKAVAHIKERQAFEESVYEPESLQAYHDLIHGDKLVPEERAILESQLVDEDREAYQNYLDTLAPEKKKKEEWQFEYGKDSPFLSKKNIYTGEIVPYTREGKRVPNPEYDPIEKYEYRDGVKITHYKDLSKAPTKTRYMDPETGKYDKKVLDKLKYTASRLSSLGQAFRATPTAESIDTEFANLSRAERQAMKLEYTKKKQQYSDAKENMENEIMFMIEDSDDNTFVSDLVTEVKAIGLDADPSVPYSNKKEEAIEYFYSELKDNLDDFANPYVMELIIQGYHEILFGEPFHKSNTAKRLRDRIRSRTQ